MAEMFVQLKLGDQRYKSKVSSVNLRRTISFKINLKKKKKKNISHSNFHKTGSNLF